MDSLLASYASDDDQEPVDDGDRNPNSSQTNLNPPPKPSNPLFSALRPPKSPPEPPSLDPKISKPQSSIFSSLPPPNQNPKKPQASLFSSLPKPKSVQQGSSDQTSRKVIQFTLPINPYALKSGDFDDDDDEEERKPVKHLPPNPSKGLASMLPAPKNSLCLAPNPSAASSRRSVLEADLPAVKEEDFQLPVQEAGDFGSYGNEIGAISVKQEDFGHPVPEAGVFGSCDNEIGASSEFADASEASSYDNGEEYGGYVGKWSDGSVVGSGDEYASFAGNWYEDNLTTSEPVPDIPEMGRPCKRGRNDIPTKILEVKQDELMKNRPREDKAKLTGIAFGPSYQAAPSGKGKPSKLHKRKHQIGSLYYDMKQKEMELAERRSKGLLTKAETQAKYGW